jgi:hypothetical protein
MASNPDRRSVVTGIGAVTAGLGIPTTRGEAQTMSEAPDIVFFNGKVATLDRGNPQAQAIAIRDSRFVAASDDRSIMALAGPNTKRAI